MCQEVTWTPPSLWCSSWILRSPLSEWFVTFSCSSVVVLLLQVWNFVVWVYFNGAIYVVVINKSYKKTWDAMVYAPTVLFQVCSGQLVILRIFQILHLQHSKILMWSEWVLYVTVIIYIYIYKMKRPVASNNCFNHAKPWYQLSSVTTEV